MHPSNHLSPIDVIDDASFTFSIEMHPLKELLGMFLMSPLISITTMPLNAFSQSYFNVFAILYL